MIRTKKIPLLHLWLVDQNIQCCNQKYTIRLWRGNTNNFKKIENDLISYVDEAFNDARMFFRKGFDASLSPFISDSVNGKSIYPSVLHKTTLQGYFGEILGPMIVEHFGAFGYDDWCVPAFLFRFHTQEFQHLDLIYEKKKKNEDYYPDQKSEIRAGRTGDDAIAFRINDKNEITHYIVFEAKCLKQHNVSEIKDAYKKLSTGPILSSAIRELINLLQDYDTEEALVWKEALVNLYLHPNGYEKRRNAILYACGQSPHRTTSWMPTDSPHKDYFSQISLEGLEIHVSDLEKIVSMIFRGE